MTEIIGTTSFWAVSNTTANKGFTLAEVPCLANTFVQGGGSVLSVKFSVAKPPHIAETLTPIQEKK